MSIATWIVFGILTGVITRLLDPRNKEESLLGSIILGIIGAVAGAVLANLIFNIGMHGTSLHTIAIGVSGSLILLFIGRLIKQI